MMAFATSSVTVYVEEIPPVVNEPPVAVISEPGEGDGFHVMELIVFRSNGSYDPEGEDLSYLWRIDGINLSVESSFALYLGEGVHVVSLFVSDGNLTSKDSITFIVTNRIPVISVLMNGTNVLKGELLTIVENETQTFDASGSYDPDGGSLTFNWSLDGEVVGTDPVLKISMLKGYRELRLMVYDEQGRSTLFIQGFSCIRAETPGPEETDSDGKEGISPAFYIIPLILIIVFIVVSAVFFLLSRSGRDVYFEE